MATTTTLAPGITDELSLEEEELLKETWSPEVFPFATEVPPYGILPFEDAPNEFRPKVKPTRYRNQIALWVFWKLRKDNKTKGAGQLDKLLDRMPMDIIFTIFEHLHPMDLYHLTRTSKSFRAILTSRGSISSWKNSYDQEPLMPRCPEWMSEPRWAHLLFGPYRCEQCNTPWRAIHVTVGRRLCDFCLEHGATINRYWWSHVHGMGTMDWALLPHPWIFDDGAFHLSHHYPSEHFTPVADEYKRLSAAVKDNPEVQKELEEFTQRQLAIVEAHQELKSGHTEKLKIIMAKVDVENAARFERLALQLNKRFRRLDFTDSDFDEARGNFNLNKCAPLQLIHRVTNRVFNQIQIAIGDHLVKQRNLRKDGERKALIEERRRVVDEAYAKYREHCIPATWAYHPPEYTVQTWEPFPALINNPSEDPLTEDDCAEGIKALPPLIEEWISSKINQLASLLPDRRRSDPTSKSKCLDPPIHDLELATAVFHCLGSVRSTTMGARCLIGWEGAGRHLRCGALKSWYGNRLHFHERGSDAAESLVAVVELDPKKTTAKEMDALRDRFLCANCHGSERKAYGWREAIRHCIDAPDQNLHTNDPPPAWILLTPEAAADIRRQEGVDPTYHEASWCCNLCPEHWHVSVKRAEAIKHVMEVHAIQKPVCDTHFIYFTPQKYTARTHIKFNENIDAKYRCARCPKSVRLYPMSVLRAHLKDKHQVTQAVETDWVEVERILRRTPLPALPPQISTSENGDGDVDEGSTSN